MVGCPAAGKTLPGDGKATVENKRTGKTFTVRATLTDRQRAILLAGGLMAQRKAGA